MSWHNKVKLKKVFLSGLPGCQFIVSWTSYQYQSNPSYGDTPNSQLATILTSANPSRDCGRCSLYRSKLEAHSLQSESSVPNFQESGVNSSDKAKEAL